MDITYRSIITFLLWLFAIGATGPVVGPHPGFASPPIDIDLKTGVTVTVRAVEPDGTIRLSDGSELVLAGLEQAYRLGEPTAAYLDILLRHSRAAPTWIVTHPVPDRYARVSGQVATADGTWLQHALLAIGAARYAGGSFGGEIRAALLEAENTARRARRGMWRTGGWRVRRAETPADIPWGFRIVEGGVTGVSRVRGRTFLNFGSDWRTDFTLGVVGRTLPAAAGRPLLRLDRLEGRRIRVRGMVRRYNGPYMDLLSQDQIEFLD